MVIVSHDLNLASQYCDRIVMLKGGELFAREVRTKSCDLTLGSRLWL